MNLFKYLILDCRRQLIFTLKTKLNGKRVFDFNQHKSTFLEVAILTINYVICMLCILTSKQVLCMPFTGQKCLFQHFNNFCCHKREKRRESAKNKKCLKKQKRGLPAFQGYSYMLAYTQMLVYSHGKYDFSKLCMKKHLNLIIYN